MRDESEYLSAAPSNNECMKSPGLLGTLHNQSKQLLVQSAQIKQRNCSVGIRQTQVGYSQCTSTAVKTWIIGQNLCAGL